MPNLNVGLFAAIVALMTFNANAGYISQTGFVAVCPKTGSDMTISAECASWCQTTYGTQNGYIYYIYGTQLTSYKCDYVGMTGWTDYKYCCANQAAVDIVHNCGCADENQGQAAGKSAYTRTRWDTTNEQFDLTCNKDEMCHCKAGYYGTSQTIANSTSGTCTKCPIWDNVYATYDGAEVYGSPCSSTVCPNSTLSSCKVGPIETSVPYVPIISRTYNDPSGTFVLSGQCIIDS